MTMDLKPILDIAALVVGTLFLVLQILHHKWMWPVDIVSCIILLVIYIPDRVWGLSILQFYYMVMAVVGIFSWNRDEELNAGRDKKIIMHRLTAPVALCSLAILIVGFAVTYLILSHFNDPAPVPDALVLVLGIVATWWLTRSYPGQWILWIIADGISVYLSLEVGLRGPALLYVFYTVSSIVGYINWRKNGVFV